jgi:hypothetical protein
VQLLRDTVLQRLQEDSMEVTDLVSNEACGIERRHIDLVEL